MKSMILAAAIAAATLGFAGTVSADSRGHYHGGGHNHGGHGYYNHGGHYHGGYHNHGHYHGHYYNRGYYAPRYYGGGYYNAYPVQPYGNSVYYNGPQFGIGFTWAR